MNRSTQYQEGLAQGHRDAAGVVQELRLVQTMLTDGRLKAQLPRDDTNPDAAPQTLAQRIEDKLKPFA